MEEILELKKQLKDAESKISTLEQELGRYQQSGPVGFYYELNRWVNSAKEYMKGKKVADLIGGEGKDFERMMVLVKNTKDNVEALSSMETLFKSITGDEEEDKTKRVSFIDRLAVKRTV